MSPEFFVQHNGIAIVVAFFILCFAIIIPLAGRIAFTLLFITFACLNWMTIQHHPEVYLQYGPYAMFTGYRDFMQYSFAPNSRTIVPVIIVLQLLLGIGFLLKNRWLQVTSAVAVLFLLFITPLGKSVAFPVPLILAAGCLVILLKSGKPEVVNMKSEVR